MELMLFFMYHRFHITVLRSRPDVFKVGDEVTAKVIAFNPENRRISLSIKAMEEGPDENMDGQAEQSDAPSQNNGSALLIKMECLYYGILSCFYMWRGLAEILLKNV